MIGRWMVLSMTIAALNGSPAQAGDAIGRDAEGRDELARGAFVTQCIDAAALAHGVPPQILLILLSVEGGRLGAVSQNANKTVDIGPMQVNDTWLPKLAAHWRAPVEATYRALRDEFCANVEGGAWILRQAVDEAKGDLLEGVQLYHSHSERHKADYLRKVLQHADRLQRQAAAGSLALADADWGAGNGAR